MKFTIRLELDGVDPEVIQYLAMDVREFRQGQYIWRFVCPGFTLYVSGAHIPDKDRFRGGSPPNLGHAILLSVGHGGTGKSSTGLKFAIGLVERIPHSVEEATLVAQAVAADMIYNPSVSG